MREFRLLAAALLVAAVLSVGLPMAAEAQLPPALYRCTVYEDNVLVGAERVVEAYVGDEVAPRAQAETEANGVCIMQVPATQDEFTESEAIRFKVNGVNAIETPDVDVTMLAPEVRLDVYTGTPLPTPTPTPTATPTPTPTPSPTPSPDDGLSGGAIAGIVVASLVALALLAWLIVRRR